MKVRKARKLRDILLAVGFVLMLAGYVSAPLLYVGIVVASSSLLPHFLFNRCPHCGKQLGINEGDFCQHCGERLDK